MSVAEQRGRLLRGIERLTVDQYAMDEESHILRRLSRASSFLSPDRVVHPPSWLGHIPFALWIVEALRPRTLVELGAHTGNSYSAFCQAVQTFNVGAACYAVDTWEGDPQAGYYGDDVFNELSAYHDPLYGAFSRLMRMTFDAACEHFADGSVDLLHIDGLHTYDAVRHDYETWLPKMSRRGVVLFHDVNVRKDDFGVWKLWEEISAARPHFTFLHSNGLGVLAVGDDFPEELRWLFEAGAEPAQAAEIRRFFDRLGSSVALAEIANWRGARNVEFETLVRGLRDELDGTLANLQSTQATVSARDGDIATLQSFIAARDEGIAQLRAHIAQQEGAVAGLNRMIDSLHGDVAERDEVICEKDAALDELNGHVDVMGRDIRTLLGEIENLRGGVRTLEQTVRHRDQKLQSMYDSTSWKFAWPVRRLGRIKDALARLCRSKCHRMTLQPLHDLIRRPDGFESVGGDPAFELVSDQGRVPSGWCVLSYTVERASAPLSPLLYVDTGAGYGQSGIIPLPVTFCGKVEALILLPPQVRALRFDPTDRLAQFAISDFTVREVGKLFILKSAMKLYRGRSYRGAAYLMENGWARTKQKIIADLLPPVGRCDYDSWVGLYDTLTPSDEAAIAKSVAGLRDKPLISIVMPTYNTPEPYLRRVMDTVLAQLYPHWEFCIADDASTLPHVAEVLKEYAAKDARIKLVFREKNGHISAASNSALEIASGEFVALLDHDDELPAHALYMTALEINRRPDVDVIYSDEDKIDEHGKRYDPYFKPDWNPDLLTGQNMVSHLGVFRRTLLTEVGGFRLGYEGSQDYDLALRVIERTDRSRIRHIPMVLYHWRVFSSSASFSTTALPTATKAARRALQDHFDRRDVAAEVVPAPGAEWYSRIVYPLPAQPPLVSLIIPTRDRVDLLRQCVDGMLNETDYPNLEVLVLDNNSQEPETLGYFAELADNPRARVLRWPGPFNYSAINNYGAAQAKGSVIGLINNDIKVIEPGWLSEMVRHALRPEVGAVGAKLYYGDDTIQHAGVVTGINGVANHVFKHLPRNHPGYFGNLKLVRNYSCVTAAALLMRKDVFDEVGGLDEKHLAVAFNDVDLCLKVRDAGYYIVWTPHAELYHLESASRGSDMEPEKLARFMREIRHMNDRWGDGLTHDPFYNPNLTMDAVDYGLAFPPRVVKPWLLK
jgi:O-antigen biosynthesis protein